MAYTKTLWRAREGANLNRFTKSQETAETVVLVNTPGTLSVPGTPFSADNMNKIEQGILDAHELTAAEAFARENADQALQQAIDAEIQARINGDQGLQLAMLEMASAIARQGSSDGSYMPRTGLWIDVDGDLWSAYKSGGVNLFSMDTDGDLFYNVPV